MRQKTRDGILIEGADGQDRLLALLYGNALGRMVLKPLTAPWLSRAAGRLLSTRASCVLIKSFIKRNKIDMSQFEPVEYESYNDFFSRRIRPEARPVDMDPRHLISPADSKLTALSITESGRFTLKHTEYTVGSLLKNPAPGPWDHRTLALARYLVNRYWLQAVSDYDLYCRVKFIVILCMLTKYLGGDLLRTAQLMSKEIENDADNVDALLDAAYAHPAFTDDKLLGMLLGAGKS